MNIREYNFAIPGNVDRHIPGIPGIFPAGSIVQVDEDMNKVVSIWPEPIEEKQDEATPDAPPAVDKKSKK